MRSRVFDTDRLTKQIVELKNRREGSPLKEMEKGRQPRAVRAGNVSVEITPQEMSLIGATR